MRKFRDPFFFAKVGSSAIVTSFQQVHLRRCEAPSELQVLHSEWVARERSEALGSTLEGVECQNSSGAKHRSCSGTKLHGGSCFGYPNRSRGLHPSHSFFAVLLSRTVSVSNL